MKSARDPAPALSRGLRLLRRLAVEGQGSLDQLARREGWPKSSTLRYLRALEAAGTVRRDAASKVYFLEEQLVPVAGAGEDALTPRWRSVLNETAEATGHCTEWYALQPRRVVLRERADPVLAEVQVQARIGFRRDLRECEATSLLYFAFSGTPREAEDVSWRWEGGKRRGVEPAERERLVEQVRKRGLAVDHGFNLNGVRRWGIPVVAAGRLAGILTVAQRQTPAAAKEGKGIRAVLQSLQAAEKESL
jgi:DNA-binding IclR family transcriptional regulator